MHKKIGRSRVTVTFIGSDGIIKLGATIIAVIMARNLN